MMKTFFVSSTFKDMQFERDILHKYVIPEINSSWAFSSGQKSGRGAYSVHDCYVFLKFAAICKKG